MDTIIDPRLYGSVRGCLRAQAARDEQSIRRLPGNLDEDGWLYGLVSPYALDLFKIQQSKALRRLKDKTQVLYLPQNAHVRDRLVHSLEVSALAAGIAEILGLHADLCRAAGLWHDTGHTPFGHRGEAFLARITGKPFRHEVMSVVLAQQVERSGAGLNLCRATLSAVRHHSRGKKELKTVPLAEDNVVMFADKIAYAIADFNDLFHRREFTGSPLRLEDFPELAREMAALGANGRDRVTACVSALCVESAEVGSVSFSRSETAQRFERIKTLMYDVYARVHEKETDDTPLERVYEALARLEPDFHPAFLFALLNDEDFARLAARPSVTAEDLRRLSISEVVEKLREAGVRPDPFRADLAW